jgi:hypothetical protein
MIHLIDRVYIEYAEAKPLPQNPLLKPESYIRIIDRGLALIVDNDVEDKNLFNVKRIEEAYEKFGSNTNFINYLMSISNTTETKKIIIYADEIATTQLMIALWKGLFPSIDSKNAFRLYSKYKDFEFLKPKDQIDFISLGENPGEIEKKDFIDLYWGKTEEQFKTFFDNTEAFELTAEQKQKVGIEYLMINYILNKESDHSELFKRADHFYKKALMKEIVALKSIASEYVLAVLKNDSKVAPELKSEKSIVDILSTHPKYNLLLDNNIVNSVKGYHYIKDNYILVKVVTDLLAAENYALNSLGITPEPKDNPCCTYIIQNHSEPNFRDHLDDEIFYKSFFRIFRELAKKGRYNQYLVHHFAIAKQEGEDLSKFSE